MSTVSVTAVDQSVQITDSFYHSKMSVNASDWDVVFSYFKNVSETEEIAKNFASIVFRISKIGNIPVTDILATLKGTNSNLEMNQAVAYYLNSFRTKTAMYGVGIVPRPNEPVMRNVVQ